MDVSGAIEAYNGRDLPARDKSTVIFAGESWLIMNMEKYNRSGGVKIAAGPMAPDIFGLAVGGFGAADWYKSSAGQSVLCADLYFSRIPGHVISLLQDARCRLLIDMSIEGYGLAQVFDEMEMLHAAIRDRRIPLNLCTFLVQGETFKRDYEAWCSDRSADSRLNVAEYDFCPRRFAGEEMTDNSKTDRDRKLHKYRVSLSEELQKQFLCLNYTPRPSRVGMVSWIFGKYYDDFGRTSFRGLGLRKDGLVQDDLTAPNWFPQQKFLKRGMARLTTIGNIEIDLNDQLQRTPDFLAAPEDVYIDTGFSLVTETDVSHGGLKRITEKSFKPIAGLHPFLIFGNPEILDILRRYGFKTFHPLIDESYDQIADMSKRTEKIMREFERLINMSEYEFMSWRQQASEIVVHNFVHFYDKLPELFDQIENRIVESMITL